MAKTYNFTLGAAFASWSEQPREPTPEEVRAQEEAQKSRGKEQDHHRPRDDVPGLRNLQNRRGGAIKQVCSLPRPLSDYLFVTLLPDKKANPKKASEPKQWADWLKVLNQAYRRRFPNGGYLYSLEADGGVRRGGRLQEDESKRGAHAHLVVDTGRDVALTDVDLMDVERWFFKTWSRRVGSRWDRLVTVDVFNEKRRGYLFKRSKTQREIDFFRSFGNRYSFGVCNEEKLRLIKPLKYTITENKMESIRNFLRQNLEAQAAYRHGEVNMRQLALVNGSHGLHAFLGEGDLRELQAILET